jgi:hypothetical protein
MTTHNPADDFEAGKKVFELLKELSPDRQERVMRWVVEGLGLKLSPTAGTGSGGAAYPPAITPPPETRAAGTPSVDIKSFVTSKAPKSDNQFAAVVAYYYRFEAPAAQRRDYIDPETLQEATRLTGRSRLGNPRATLNNAKSTGYLDSNAPGEFSINSVGENLVAMTLPGEASSGTGSSRRKVATKKRGSKK